MSMTLLVKWPTEDTRAASSPDQRLEKTAERGRAVESFRATVGSCPDVMALHVARCSLLGSVLTYLRDDAPATDLPVRRVVVRVQRGERTMM